LDQGDEVGFGFDAFDFGVGYSWHVGSLVLNWKTSRATVCDEAPGFPALCFVSGRRCSCLATGTGGFLLQKTCQDLLNCPNVVGILTTCKQF
jgi:hypothetical protein